VIDASPQPTVTDPTVTDPTVTDPTVTDPTVTDPTVTDPTVVGIDIAKSTFEVALITPRSSGKPRHKQFANSADGFEKLTAWLLEREVSQVHACLEATGIYGDDLAHFLHQAGYQVSVVNPARIKAFAQSQLSRNKTDKADAALIAQFCQSQHPPLWSPPEPMVSELQALMRHLESLLQTQQQQKNRQEAERSDTVKASLQSLIDYLSQEIERLKKQIQDHIDQHPALKQQQSLLVSIPGLGPLTAAKLLGEVTQFSVYNNARQVAAYAGLTPRQHQSGSSVRGQTRLSKIGNSRVRKALYMPALVAMRHNPLIQTFCQRLRERGKCSMVIVGAVMRKLLHLAYGVLKSGQPFNPNYLQANPNYLQEIGQKLAPNT